MIPERWHLPLLAAIAALLFLTHLGALDIMPPDEPRYAQVSQEMLQSGNYLAPTLNGEAYKEKPPMLFWLSAIAGHATGDVGPWAARLPSALAAIATILLTYLLARGMFGAETALLSALVLMTIGRFWWQARVGQIDMLLTAFVTAAIYALWRWNQNRRSADLAFFYAMLVLGMLTKGPPALVFPALLIAVFYWKQGRELRGLKLPVGLLMVVFLFLVWLIPARMAASGMAASGGSEQHAFGEVLKQTVGRFLLGVSKAEMPWYYVINLPKDLLPWTPVVLGTLLLLWRARKDDDAMRFLWAWVLPAFIFFTISIAKRVTYILPLYPAFAILIALGAQRGFALLSAQWRFRVALFWGAFVLALGLTPWLVFRHQAAAVGLPVMIAWCGVALVCGLDGLRRAAGKKLGELPWMLAMHTAALLVVSTPLIAIVYNAKYSVREFCAPVAAAAEKGEDFDLYSLALFREELRYYARHHQIQVLMDPLEVEGSGSLSGLKAQADLRSSLRSAVGPSKLTLEDTSKNVPGDQAKLTDTLNAFIAGAKKQEETAKLTQALKDELDRFEAKFMGEKKALCIVEERDWRWLRAVEPELAAWHVVQTRKLVDRTLYLIANPAGEALLK